MSLNLCRVLALLALFAAGAVSAAEKPAPFEAGKHYTVISEEATAEPVVMEFFSYGCPHCYSFQPYMDKLKAALGESVEFQYVPVDFGGGYWTPTQELYLVLEALGRLEELHMDAFKHVHEQRRFIRDSGDARAFAAAHDISAEEYAKAAKSFAAHVRKKRYDQLTERYRITGTPTIIVNGKYRVELPELKGGQEQFTQLVRHLLTNP
ncbi:MAG TPA: thiol:disulfide interchange protein DsbA/DsbL [Gammaproteobacteria bacterium]